MLTIFFSTIGLETATDTNLEQLLIHEGLIRFSSEARYLSAGKLVDASGHELWTVNVVIGDEESTFVDELHAAHSLRPTVGISAQPGFGEK